MKNCEISCGGTPSAGLDTQHTVSKIFKRLPRYLQDTFMAEVSLQLERGQPIAFTQLSEFKQRRALVKRSYLGQLMSRRVDKSSVESFRNLHPFRKASINAAQNKSKNVNNALLDPREQSCAFCQTSDALWKCDKFIKESIENRWNLVRTTKLCFICLGTHIARECRSKTRCRYCDGRHHSLLHGESLKSRHTVPGSFREEWETSDRAGGSLGIRPVVSAGKENLNSRMPEYSCSQSSITCGTINAKAKASRNVRLKVIPVTVWSDTSRKHEKVYAFLDEGSDITLCTNALMKRLGARGKSVQYTLSTLGGVDSKQGFETRLNVRGYCEQAIMNLCSVLSVFTYLS